MTPDEIDEKLQAARIAIELKNWSDAIAFFANLTLWCYSEFAKENPILNLSAAYVANTERSRDGG